MPQPDDLNLYPREDSAACWIAVNDWRRDADPVFAFPSAFRWDLTLDDIPLEGEIVIAASSHYLLWINGRLISRGPARSKPSLRFLDHISLNGLLVEETNAIAIMVLPPTGVTGYSCPTRTGLLCSGKVVTATKTINFDSGPHWKVKEADWISSHGWVTSLPTGWQEHWNQAKESKTWHRAPCVDWENARLLGPAGTPPWKHLHRRPIPLLKHEPIIAKLIWEGLDDKSPGDPGSNLRHSFLKREIQGGKVTKDERKEFTAGSSNVFVFDLMKTRLVTPRLIIDRAGSGAQIEVYYEIGFQDRPGVMTGFDDKREGFSDSIQLSGDSYEWQPLQSRGCRFVTIRVSSPGACHFRVEWIGTEYSWEADLVRFETSEDSFSRYWQTSAESLKSCCTDVIVDTCARENVLWTFDACVSAKAAFYTFGETALWRHCLAQIGLAIDSDGIPSAVVPAEPSFMILYDQGMQWVVSCWEYYLCSGDDSFASAIVPIIVRFLENCRTHLTKDGLFVPPAFSWHWVDWAPLDRRAYSLPVNASLLRASKAACHLAEFHDRHGLKDVAVKISGLLENAIEKFFDERANLYRDHLEPQIEVGLENSFLFTSPGDALTYSLHGNSQALTSGGRGVASQINIMRECLARIGSPEKRLGKFGPGWSQILLQPFVDAGFASEVVEVLAQNYGSQLATGSLTWAEGFGPCEHNTAHGWGSAVNSLIVESFFGIRPLAPGWREVEICPRVAWDFQYELKTKAGKVGVRKSSEGVFLFLASGMTGVTAGKRIEGKGAWERVG